MHTLLIHQAFAAASDPGGTRHLELARCVVEAGEEFTIVASDVNYGTGRRVTPRLRFATEEKVDGIRVVRSFTPAWVRRSYVLRVCAFLVFTITATINGLRAGPVDVVMGTSPPIFQAISAWLIAFVRGKPFLLEIRDLWPEFAIDIGILKNECLIWMSRRFEMFLYHRATHLVVNSPAYREYLIEKGVPSEKVSLIANGVDPSLFSPEIEDASIRNEFNFHDKFVVTYAGAFGMANDLDTLVRAADRLRSRSDIHILLVGDGKERERLHDEVAKRKLENVTFCRARPKREIPAVLAASDACVATLKDIAMFRTTYPNKVFDYMAAGRPTLLAIDGVIRDVIEKANGGIFCMPGDDVALADAILALAENPVRARQMGVAAREYVVRNFNRRDQAMNFLVLLRSMTGSRLKADRAD
jgi:glycosyltransferase involved in cell wall biosynthesis